MSHHMKKGWLIGLITAAILLSMGGCYDQSEETPQPSASPMTPANAEQVSWEENVVLKNMEL